MAITPPKAFISHSSQDKPIARRVARRLSQYGIQVWIDERELKLTESLFSRFQEEIRASTHFIIILTPNALNSDWVARETDAARLGGGRQPAIVPLMFDGSVKYPIWNEYKGADLTHPLRVEAALEDLARIMLNMEALPAPQEEKVIADLARVRGEDVKLAMLFDIVDGKYAPSTERMEAIHSQGFNLHNAEFALWCAYSLADRETKERIVRDCCAWLFAAFGIGSWPLSRYLAGADDVRQAYLPQVLWTATARRLARSDLLDRAFEFYAALTDEYHTQFAGFIQYNFDDFTEAHRERALNYVFQTDRGPGGSFSSVVSALYDRMPESAGLEKLWRAWIRNGFFSGAMGVAPKEERRKAIGDNRKSESAEYLFRHMRNAASDGYKHYAVLDETIAYFVREQCSHPSTVLNGFDFVLTARKERFPKLADLYGEVSRGLDSHVWREYDPEYTLIRKLNRVLWLAEADRDLEALYEAIDELQAAMAKAPPLPARY